MTEPCRLLLVSGSLREGSTNSAALRTAARLAPDFVDTTLYEGMAVLPAFSPDIDDDPLPAQVADLRQRIRETDAVVFSTPEYAGDLPGSFKNLLDWTVGDDQPGSIYAKPVAWLNVSPRGARDAHASLRRVLGYVGATVVEAACAEIPVTSDLVGADGLVSDAAVLAELSKVLQVLVDASRAEVLPDASASSVPVQSRSHPLRRALGNRRSGCRWHLEVPIGAPRPGGPRR